MAREFRKLLKKQNLSLFNRAMSVDNECNCIFQIQPSFNGNERDT